MCVFVWFVCVLGVGDWVIGSGVEGLFSLSACIIGFRWCFWCFFGVLWLFWGCFVLLFFPHFLSVYLLCFVKIVITCLLLFELNSVVFGKLWYRAFLF